MKSEKLSDSENKKIWGATDQRTFFKSLKTKTMKTLLKRLKPELIIAMGIEEKKYPLIMTSLKDELSRLYFCNDMTISNAYRLTSLTEKNIFGITELHNCFEPYD